MLKTKISLSVIIVLALCSGLRGQEPYTLDVLEHNLYRVPCVHGQTNRDSMRGLGFVMGWYCPRELCDLYAKAWGYNAYYSKVLRPQNTEDWRTDLPAPAWDDYTIGLMGVRSIANQAFQDMTAEEKDLLTEFCGGINDAINKIFTEQISWYQSHLKDYEDHFGSPVAFEPKHIIALNLYDFVVGNFNKYIYNHFGWFGPNPGEVEHYDWASQMWSFVDNEGIP